MSVNVGSTLTEVRNTRWKHFSLAGRLSMNMRMLLLAAPISVSSEFRYILKSLDIIHAFPV
jgi:hypothetical protein